MVSNISAVLPFTVTDVIAVAALLAAVFVAILGSGIILDFIRGPELGTVSDDGEYDDFEGRSNGLSDDAEDENPLGKSIY